MSAAALPAQQLVHAAHVGDQYGVAIAREGLAYACGIYNASSIDNGTLALLLVARMIAGMPT